MRSQCFRDHEARELQERGEATLIREVKPQPELTTWPTPLSSEPAWTWKWPRAASELNAVVFSTWGLERVLPRYCPLGQVGEQRWVRETWAPYADDATREYCQTHDPEWGEPIKPAVYAADYTVGCPPLDVGGCEKWRSPVTMPHWASRATVGVVERDVFVKDNIWCWRARVRRERDNDSD